MSCRQWYLKNQRNIIGMFVFQMKVVVVVVVVYLTTNQRHLGYLSSGNGHLAGRYSTP